MINFFPQEQYTGNIEYKALIQFPNNKKIERFTTQVYYRLREGEGKAIYLIGITDNGQLFITIDNIKLLYNSIIQLENNILNHNNFTTKKNIFTYNNYIYCIYTIKQPNFKSLEF